MAPTKKIAAAKKKSKPGGHDKAAKAGGGEGGGHTYTPVNMSFADPNTIEAGEGMQRTVRAEAFSFGVQDRFKVMIGDGRFTSDASSTLDGTPKWLTGKFANDKKVSIDFNVAENIPSAGPWQVFVEHTTEDGKATNRFVSETDIVFLG